MTTKQAPAKQDVPDRKPEDGKRDPGFLPKINGNEQSLQSSEVSESSFVQPKQALQKTVPRATRDQVE